MHEGPPSSPAPEASNDNLTPEQIRQRENVVIPFPRSERVVSEELEIDGTRLTALRQQVSRIQSDFPFILNKESIKEAEESISTLTQKDVIRLLNSLDPNALIDFDTVHYQAILNRLQEEFIEE